MKDQRKKYMRSAIRLAGKGMLDSAGGPFGCVIVKDGKIIARGHNSVINQNDPTAHAEVVAIRKACRKLKSFQLTGCEIYCTCEPCPMCMGAIYWSRPEKVYFACTRHDAALAGFDDEFIYSEMPVPFGERKIPFEHFPVSNALELFDQWNKAPHKVVY